MKSAKNFAIVEKKNHCNSNAIQRGFLKTREMERQMDPGDHFK